MSSSVEHRDRYARQRLLPFIGEDGQRRIANSTVAVVGCGALGTVSAGILARAGVGQLTIIDRDFVELSNLQRQTLFDEKHARERIPKAVAAAETLRRVNSSIRVESVVADLNAGNALSLLSGCIVIVDGTDNFESRLLINDLSVRERIPWVYGAAVASVGLSMTILPGVTPCLRCVYETAPSAELSPTCDTAGVLSTVTGLVANVQATEALKICAGNPDAVSPGLLSVDLWEGEFQRFPLHPARPNCPCCGRGEFTFLSGRDTQLGTYLCGRDAVQITPQGGPGVRLDALARRWRSVPDLSDVHCNRFLLRARVAPGPDATDPLEITVFPDARAIVKGTRQVDRARVAYARFVGT